MGTGMLLQGPHGPRPAGRGRRPPGGSQRVTPGCKAGVANGFSWPREHGRCFLDRSWWAGARGHLVGSVFYSECPQKPSYSVEPGVTVSR